MSNIFKRAAAVLMALAIAASMAACVKDNAGGKEQQTQAVTVGTHTLSAVELNYFFVDAVVEWYNFNANYAYLMGFDPTKPLSQQIISSATGETWADSFLNTALDNIRSTYALYDMAIANGFQLSAADQAQIDAHIQEMEDVIAYYSELYQSMGYTYPYSTVDDYLLIAYGAGSSMDTYLKYYEVCTVSNAYYYDYFDSLTYNDITLRQYEADKYAKYNSYSYAVYYVAVKDYESAEQAEAVAQQLADGAYADQAAFDEAIRNLDINAGTKTPKLSEIHSNELYSKLSDSYAQWLADAQRISGDMTAVPHMLVADDADSLQGYYVVRFENVNDNNYYLKNVRHLLCAFEGGVTNAITGETTYSRAEKEAARKDAEKLYVEFCTGSMTELVFAALANQHSDDGDGTTGGLYENLPLGQMVAEFENWCYDPIRRSGDVEMVETEYGWHILYFVGSTDYTYRDYLLTNDKKVEDVNAWYKALIENMQIELLDDTYVNKDLVLSQ